VTSAEKSTRDGEALRIHLATIPLRAWSSTIALGLFFLVAGLLAEWQPWMIALVLAFIVAGFLFQIALHRSSKDGPVMTLDASGITVRDHPTVPWSSIDHGNVSSAARGRNRFLRLGARRLGDVVAFVPKPNVVMPPPSGGSTDRDGWAQTRQRRFGTNLTVMTALMDVGTVELTRSAERWGEVQTRHE